jgi:hypothetical protein
MTEKSAIFGAGWTGHMKNDLSVYRLVQETEWRQDWARNAAYMGSG